MSPTAFPNAPLPTALTDVIGREHDIAAVRAMLASTRLVTLTGAGGSGKTRLALAAARAMVEDDGATALAWIELASLSDPALVPMQVAVALGARAEGGGSLEQAIHALLQERPVLVVLDNCEHLVEACAGLVDRALRAAPQLRVLATSREALGVEGERSWLVPTLALPDTLPESVEAARTFGALRLFEERAREARAGFQLTAEQLPAVFRICQRLDGLPLAIELAAARVAVLTPTQLAERLTERLSALGSGARTAPPRQRTLRGAVDWSYDLLTEAERLLLGRLSAFVGGFTLETAEAVCGFGALPAADVLDVLASLATKSLVAMQEEQGQARYRLLEIIRDHAQERQAARGEDEVLAERHALAMRALVERAEPEVVLGRRERLHELDLEHGNLLAALAWSGRAGRGADVGLPIAFRLLWYWFHRQLWHEGFAQCEAALASAERPVPELRAAALHGLGVFGLHGLNPGARAWLEEARDLWRASGNWRWYAFTTLVLVVEASLRRDVPAAGALAEEMLAVARGQPDPWDAALAKAHAMVPILNWREEWAAAETMLAEALETFRARGYDTGVSYALDAQAYVALRQGDLERATTLAHESLRAEADRENRWLAGRSLRILASVAHRRGDLARALRLFGITDGWYRALGASALTGERAVVNDLRAVLRAEAPPELWTQEYEAGAGMRFRAAIEFALQGAVEGDVAATPAAETPVDDAPSAPLDIRALGAVRMWRDGTALPDDAWPYAKPRELLLYLLSHPDGRTREQIGLDFWPDVSAAQVKNNFHVTLHHLRKTLGDASWVRFEKGRYRIAAPGVSFDAAQFAADVEGGLRRLRADAEDAGALAQLEQAVARYAGPFLEHEGAGDWHVPLRDRLARLHAQALMALAEAASVEGRHDEAAERCRQLLRVDPLDEEAVRLLMLTLARAGRRSDALRAYDRLAEELRREMDAVPGPPLQRLADAVRAGERV